MSWVDMFADKKDMRNINSFVEDLQTLLEKHEVWMNVDYGSHNDEVAVVEFLHNNSDGDVDWWIEMVDLWPESSVEVK